MNIFIQTYHKNKYVAACNPLSRSYFKTIEIMKIFKLEVSSKPIQSFQFAEGLRLYYTM